MNKVVIFGIDGGSLKLIEQWRNELPNLKRIMEGGVFGELESTIPPVTCPAWPCMFTGKNPGKIGMYSFTSVETGGDYRIEIKTSLEYHQWSLWRILNNYGIPVGLLNVAMTFPPHKVDSFMVCGTGAPVSGRTNYTYPTWLKKELNRAVPGYEVLPPIVLTIPGREQEYKAVLEQAIRKRLQAARYLMNAFSWQLFVAVFFALDSAQHYFWHHMDEIHPKHKGEKFRDVIKELYKMVDTAIGELVEKLPEENNVLIVSDHGFGPCHGSFVLSRWLEKEGLLTFLPQTRQGGEIPWLWHIRDFLLSLLGTRVARLISKLIPEWLAMKLSSREKAGYDVVKTYRNIDWAQTKAYPGAGTGTIRINLKDREPSGIVNTGDEYEKLVDDIMGRLKKIKDPVTGQPVNIAAFKKSEIYHGHYANIAPDIAFHIDRYMTIRSMEQQSEWSAPPYSGWHTRRGLFIAYGPDIKNNGERLTKLKIYDITPTALHMFGLSVPDDMDGRVLTEIFKPDSEPARRETTYEGVDDKARRKIEKLKNSDKVYPSL